MKFDILDTQGHGFTNCCYMQRVSIRGGARVMEGEKMMICG